MRRRPLTQPTVTLTHPNDPSVTVTIRKPTRAEGMRFGQELSTHQRALQVKDETGSVVMDTDGVPRTVFQQLWPLEVVLGSLEMSVVGWSGIEDAAGHAIPCEPANLPVLFEEFLDVKEDGKITKAFATWIGEQTRKEKLFDPDPTVGAS